MADYFSQQPNYTNPDYASPEQLANARAYADALTKRSGEPANRPLAGLANIIDALNAGFTRNSANQTQLNAAQGNAADMTAIISQLQNGQKLDPATQGHIIANPMVSPEQRALAIGLMNPKPIEDVAGRPGYASPSQGVQGTPVQGQFQPGFRAPQSAGEVSTVTPIPAPPYTPPGVTRLDPAAMQSWRQSTPAPGGPPGQGAPQVPGSPPAPAPAAVPNTPMGLDQLAAKGREFAAQKAFTQGSAEASTGVAKQDIEGAANAPTIKRVAGVMLDDLHRSGDKMTFGPTAEWSNNVKRIAANYAPGLMKDQLEALSSADSFDKMSAQLTSLLSKGGSTDAALFNNMRSVPGSHNSKEGAEALLKMTLQVADQSQALRQTTAGAKDAQQYEALRNDFYQKNPIINPITGNPIKLDLEKQAKGGGARIISVEGPK